MKSISVLYCKNKYKRIMVFNYLNDYQLLIAYLCLQKSLDQDIDILISYRSDFYNTKEFNQMIFKSLRS